MRLKWKLRLSYGAMVFLLLALLGAVTASLVRRDFQREVGRREAETAGFARGLVEERLAAIDSAVARAARDPALLLLARRDLLTSRDATLTEWVALAAQLAQAHDLPLLKILDTQGRVLSSAHWQASYGLADSPGLVLALEAPTGTRLVRDRDAAGEFLALEAPRWLGTQLRYVVLGGVRADSVLERDLSARAGVPARFVAFEKPLGSPATPLDSAAAAAPLAAGPSPDSVPDSVPTPSLVLSPGPAPAGVSWIPLRASPSESTAGILLEFDRSDIARLERQLLQAFGAAALVGTLLAWTLGWWLSSRVTRPLEELTEGVAVLAAGRRPQPVRVEGSGEVRDLVASFNHMAESLADSRERLRRAERISAWREVARRVAHEIKNALTPIQLAVDNVARSVHTGKGDLAKLAEESATTVRGEVETLTRLVNAFNEMARLPDPEPKPHRLVDTWERAATPFQDRLVVESTGLDALPVLAYDDDQVRRALHNLILNAAEAGARRVQARAAVAGRGYALTVADDGPGIAPEDLEHLFEPYFTRKEGGTGLGLAIVYKICADHGWTVRAASPADPDAPPGSRGASFTLGIPADGAVRPDPAPRA